MASVHLTRYGTWEVKWRENGHPKSQTKKTEDVAERLKSKVEERLQGGGIVIRSKDAPTLEDFAAAWLASRKKLERSTRDKYEEWLEVHVLPILGHLSVADLKPRLLQEWQDQRLEEGAGPAVLGKTQTLLARILKKAVLPYEYLDANPVLALEKPEYEKREHRWLTASEVEALRDWYLERDDLGSATLVSVLAYVGIRPQDALALERGHVGERLTVIQKVSQGEIKAGSKTGDRYRRTVYLPEPVSSDLGAWMGESETQLLFAKADGKPWTKNDWDNWRSRIVKGKKGYERGYSFKQAAEDIGLGAALKPYDLRHTCATLCAAAGWTHVEIANQLGHSPEESMRTYQHLIDSKPGERRSIEDYITEARVRDSFGISVS